MQGRAQLVFEEIHQQEDIGNKGKDGQQLDNRSDLDKLLYFRVANFPRAVLSLFFKQHGVYCIGQANSETRFKE